VKAKTKPESPPVVCAWCGETIEDPDEAANPRMIDGEIICDESWEEHFAFRCCLCENLEENEFQRTHIVVIDSREAFGVEWRDGNARVRHPRGIYEVLSCPYFSAPLIGSGSLWAESLKRIAPVPKEVLEAYKDEYYSYPCGHLCESCLEKAAPKLWAKIKGKEKAA